MKAEIIIDQKLIERKLQSLLKRYGVSLKEKEAVYTSLAKVKEYVVFIRSFEKRIAQKVADTRKLQAEFNREQNKIVKVAFALEKAVPHNLLQKGLRELFREIVGAHVVLQSKIGARAYLKPRGYAGDYYIFEMLYNDKILSKGIGSYLDGWILTHALTEGMRYRKDKLRNFLKAFIQEKDRDMEVLNVGCGPCREIRDFLEEKSDLRHTVSFLCVDQDAELLHFAKKAVKNSGSHVKISFLRQDAFKMIGFGNSKCSVPPKDLVYSLGVADYFLKNALGKFIEYCYRILKPGGRLIIPLCCSYQPELYVHLRWFCEWHFYSYQADMIRKFVQRELGFKKAKVIWEKPQPVFFITVDK